MWSIFAALAASLVVITAGQAALVIALIAYRGAWTPEAIEAVTSTFMVDPPVVMGLFAAAQFSFLSVAVAAALLSPQPTLQRLGLVRPRGPLWHLPIFAVGAAAPVALGIVMAYGVVHFVGQDESVDELYARMTPGIAVPFILFIALVPGFCEELFCRGYIQRRFLERWRPWIAILFSSVIFAVLHGMPQVIAFAFPIGVWLGILAWRTGAIWAGAVCHAFVNGTWNVWFVGTSVGWLPEELPAWLWTALALVAAACFVLSVWLLTRTSGTPATGVPKGGLRKAPT